MPTYNRGECACCGPAKTPTSCYTLEGMGGLTSVPFTYQASGTDYYGAPKWRDDNGKYHGTVGAGAYVTWRIIYNYDSTDYKDVTTPITDSNVTDIGPNTLELDGVTFDDGGYRFTNSGRFRVTGYVNFPNDRLTYDVTFDNIANSGSATITPIQQ